MKVSVNQAREWFTVFETEIKPICIKQNLSLHETFELLRGNDDRLYQALSGLWHTYFGKCYLRDLFRGGHISARREEEWEKKMAEIAEKEELKSTADL